MKKLIIYILLIFPSIAFAQGDFHMGGITTDIKTGEALPGVNIYLKNSPGVGTSTDINGKFTIKASKGDVIVATYIGYENFEFLVEKEDKNLKLQLKESSYQVDEVVITALGGTQKRVNVTGAITTVNVADLQVPAASIANTLGGRVPGVISMQTSGEPGKNISEFWIRGIGTFGANSSALVLIDGLEGDINSIDPADIESFSILKDASATAVYGVRGANGVVLVTTKRGLSGRLKITSRANFSISHLNRMPEYLNAYEYAKLANEARVVRGDEPLYDEAAMKIIQYGLDPDLYPNVDWQKELMKKNSFEQTYYVSAQGGGSIARYFLSLGMTNEGAAYNYDKSSPWGEVKYNTYNYRTNLDINLTKSTTVYFGMDGYLTVQKQPGIANTDNLWKAQAKLSPLTIPKMYSTGQIPAYGAEDSYSPYVMLNKTGASSNNNYSGKVTLAIEQDFSSLLKGLKLRIQGAYDNKSYFYERRYVLPEMYYASSRDVNGNLQTAKTVDAVSAQYTNSQRQYRKYHFESTLNYDAIFAKDHRLSALVYYYMSDSKDTYDIDNNGNINKSMAAIPKRYQGISSRITYGFKDTYMTDFNFGYTGSENFEPGRQFGFFPSVSIGWVPTNYGFIKKTFPWLSFLKLRASYGSVGNDKISNDRFPYLTLVNENYYGGWASSSGGITETTIGANNLQWEKAIKSDVGIEGRLFDEKVNFVIDFFNDKRNGIFQKRATIPYYVGLVDMPYGNVGEMKSYGSDGNISYTQDINKDMSFTLRGNFTYARNEVENWEQAYTAYDYQKYNGQPYSSIRGYISLGLFRDEQDITNSPIQNFGSEVMPGDIKYKDVTGDGVINTDDMVPLSYPTTPRLMYGFGGEFKYKDFTLGCLFKGTGNTDFFYVGQTVTQSGVTYDNGMGYVPFHSGATGNVLTIVADQSNRWTPASYSGDASTENPNARFPRLTYGYNANNSQRSTFWKGNSKYLRLQEVTLNYNWKKEFMKKIGLSSIDFQLIGSNLFVWDNVDLFDPEQALYDGQAYPIPASYALQIYLNF